VLVLRIDQISTTANKLRRWRLRSSCFQNAVTNIIRTFLNIYSITSYYGSRYSSTKAGRSQAADASKNRLGALAVVCACCCCCFVADCGIRLETCAHWSSHSNTNTCAACASVAPAYSRNPGRGMHTQQSQAAPTPNPQGHQGHARPKTHVAAV